MARRIRSIPLAVRGVRGQRRETLWFGFGPTNATLTVAGGTIMFALSAGGLARRPFTVLRTYTELMLVSDQAAAIETQILGWGWAVVSDEAVAIGVTAVPTPITDIESDLWFQHKVLMADESNLTDRTKSGGFASLDSKAMRKVESGQDLVGVAELSTVGSGFVVSVAGRMLIQLH